MSATAAVERPARVHALLVLVLIGVPAWLLYGRHLHDPLLFDSVNWFSEGNLRALGHPAGSDRIVSKTLTYCLYQLSGGRNEVLRLVSLALHVGTAYVLFLLLRRLAPLATRSDGTAAPAHRAGAAIALAALFTLHPVQVYAVAYHAQMEIVLATLFSMLMLLAYLEGVERSSRRLLLLGVLFYLLAVLSKENLVGMPAVALVMTLLLRRPSRALVREVWPFFALCAVIAVWIVARELAEPRQATYLGETAAAAAHAPGSGGLHARSIVTQGFLFFRYLLLWAVPYVGWMSIDIQYPLAPALLTWPESAGFAAFCLYPIAASWLLLRRGRPGLVGFGLLWPWLLFLPELSTTRLTEVFVLYRGYPWIAGFLLALVVAAAPWLGRAAVPLLGLACLGLALLAHERLATFRSAHAVWNDAVEKNRPYERRAVGTYRAYLNRGEAFLQAGRPEAALRDFANALELEPGLPYASFNEGLAYIRLGQYLEALRAFNEGIAHAGEMPAIARAAAYSNRAGVYLLLARPHDAMEDLAKAAALDPAREEYRTNLERLRLETRATR